MKYKLQDFIDSERINILLDLFHKTTGFVTAILDLEGNVLSKSGWRKICTDFHRVNPKTCKKCTESDTALAGQLAIGEKYHTYKCLNGLVDVAVPIILNGEHVGNLFTGQFLSKEPDLEFFRNQAIKYGFDEETYIGALENVPVVSEKDAKIAMDFLLNMTLLFCDMTMQKTEQRKSEQLYHDLVETAQDLIWRCDAEGRYTYLNPEWENVFGYKVEEMLEKKFSDFQTKKWAERDMKEFFRLLKGNTIKGLETVHIAKDGKNINLIFNAKVVYDNEGNIVGTHGTAYNITERKNADKEVKNSEEKYRSLFENITNSFALHKIVLNDEGVPIDYIFVEANQAFGKQVGVNINEIIGKKVTEIFPGIENDPADWIGKYGKVALTGEEIRFEQYFQQLNSWYKVLAYSNKKDHFATIFTDISEQKNIEEALKRSEYVLNEAQRISKIGGWEYDVESGETYFSDEVFNIYGLPKNRMFKAEEGMEFYHPDDRQLVSASFTKALSDSIPYDIEVRFINAHGKNRWVRTAGKPVSKNGMCVKILGTLMDITDRKHAEEKIKNQLDELKRFNATMIEREIKMIMLKQEINDYCKKLNLPVKYSIPKV